MRAHWRYCVAGGLLSFLAVATSVAVAGDRQGGNAGPGGPAQAQPAAKDVPSSPAGPGGAVLLAGIRPFQDGLGAGPSGGPLGTHGYLMNVSPFGTQMAIDAFFAPLLTGMTKQPGPALLFSFSSTFADGGLVYHLLPGGAFVLAGPGVGGGSMAGLAYDQTGALWTSADSVGFNDAFYSVDVVSGVATLVGSYGSGICGVDGIADDPTTNVMYGFTGFCFDGSPGDVLIIDKLSGVAVDTGIDLTDSSGNLPVCSVVGASFSADGTGYASIGCHYGQVIQFNTTGVVPFQFQVLGNPFLGFGLAGGSMTDIAVIF
ncbi:MAG: hypothetical protein O7B99_01365 [Planctomycetota bacterium]|nr:hypothetical protein [Planctomycetota bacterium]